MVTKHFSNHWIIYPQIYLYNKYTLYNYIKLSQTYNKQSIIITYNFLSIYNSHSGFGCGNDSKVHEVYNKICPKSKLDYKNKHIIKYVLKSKLIYGKKYIIKYVLKQREYTMASVKCCKCSHEWETRQKSYGHPRWCPECKNPNWDSGVKKIYMLDGETKKINVSARTFENLFRCKQTPDESHVIVVDHLLQDPTVCDTITYRSKPTEHSVRISKVAYEKLHTLKKEHNIKRIDEVLWQVMHNDTNRKL